MTDELRIPVTIHASELGDMLAAGRAGFHLVPPDPHGQGFQLREWPLGDTGLLATTEHGQLVHVDVAATGDVVDTLAEPEVREAATKVIAYLPFGVGATVASAPPDSDDRQLRVITFGDPPERWVRMDPSGLLVGLRGDDELAALAFHSRVRRPVTRNVLLRAAGGWSAETTQWYSGTGSDHGTSVQLHRPHPSMDQLAQWQDAPMAPPGDYEHEPSLDLAANLVLVDGAFDGFDAQVRDGSVELPGEVVEVDEVEVEWTWPAPKVPVWTHGK